MGYLPFTSLVWNWVWNSHDRVPLRLYLTSGQLVYVLRAANGPRFSRREASEAVGWKRMLAAILHCQ